MFYWLLHYNVIVLKYWPCDIRNGRHELVALYDGAKTAAAVAVPDEEAEASKTFLRIYCSSPCSWESTDFRNFQNSGQINKQ